MLIRAVLLSCMHLPAQMCIAVSKNAPSSGLSALKQAATQASVVVPDGGFQSFPDVKTHGGCGQRGTAHLLLSVAATVHGLVYTR
jgi:hypothetical protein